jgi:hypothetical protein
MEEKIKRKRQIIRKSDAKFGKTHEINRTKKKIITSCTN